MVEEQTWIQTVWDGVSSTGVTNIATAAGVLAALYLGSKASRERRKESHAEALADARMVRILYVAAHKTVEYSSDLSGVTGLGEPIGFSRSIVCRYQNRGSHPILDLRLQVWLQATPDLTAPPTLDVKTDSAFPDRKADEFDVAVPPEQKEAPIQAWRLVWTDRHGNRWSVDTVEQTTPQPLKNSETKPRVNGSEIVSAL